jgi:hypothetical protein
LKNIWGLFFTVTPVPATILSHQSGFPCMIPNENQTILEEWLSASRYRTALQADL